MLLLPGDDPQLPLQQGPQVVALLRQDGTGGDIFLKGLLGAVEHHAVEARPGTLEQQIRVGAVVQMGIDRNRAAPADRPAQVHIPLRAQEAGGVHARHHHGREPRPAAGGGHPLHGVQGVHNEGPHGVAASPGRLQIVHKNPSCHFVESCQTSYVK